MSSVIKQAAANVMHTPEDALEMHASIAADKSGTQ